MRAVLLFILFTVTALATEHYNAVVYHYCDCSRCGNYYVDSSGNTWSSFRRFDDCWSGKVDKKVTTSGTEKKEGVTLRMPTNIPYGTKVHVSGNLLGICQDRDTKKKMMEPRTLMIGVFVDSHKKVEERGTKKVMMLLEYANKKDYKKALDR